MNKEQLLRTFDDLAEMQRPRSFILTGVCLRPKEISLIKEDLTPDEPNVGAQGRFEGLPVFDLEVLRSGAIDFEVLVFDKYNGISYSYVQMDCVD